MSDESDSASDELRNWVKGSMSDLVMAGRRRLGDTLDLWFLTVDGIDHVKRLGAVADGLRELGQGASDQGGLTEERYNQIKERAVRAASVMDSEYSALNKQTLVIVWGTVESAVFDVLRMWLTLVSASWESPAVKSTRLDLAFVRRSRAEQAELLFEELLRQKGGGRHSGPGRFLGPLNEFSIRPVISPEQRRALLVASELRNAIVHRAGLVDRALAAACPFLSLEVGKPVVVNIKDFWEYYRASYAFLESLGTALEQRVAELKLSELDAEEIRRARGDALTRYMVERLRRSRQEDGSAE